MDYQEDNSNRLETKYPKILERTGWLLKIQDVKLLTLLVDLYQFVILSMNIQSLKVTRDIGFLMTTWKPLYRLHQNRKLQVESGSPFRILENFVDRYTNVGGGMNYDFIIPRLSKRTTIRFEHKNLFMYPT